MADPISKQLLKAYKDPVSYSKFLTGDKAWQTSSVKANIIGIDDSSKSLKAVQNLLKLQIQNQRVPIQFVKNDFKREKIDHNEIEKRINTSNSISKEINRIAEDFRATLFNIGNMREFDNKLNLLLQNDLGELLDIQRELTLAESRDEFKGDSIKRISYIQEKMYKTMERIQHHFVVQQDIKKKEQKQNIVINVNQGLPGKGGKPGQVDTTQPTDTGSSFLESLFQYLGIRRIAKAATTVAAGKVATDILKKDTARIAKNSARLRLFFKKHPWLRAIAGAGNSLRASQMSKAMGKVGLVASVITAAGVYGVAALDEAEYGSLLNSFSRLLSGISKNIRESLFGYSGSSMKDFYDQSFYMKSQGSFGSVLKGHAYEAARVKVTSFVDYIARGGLSYAAAGGRYAKDWAKYGLGLAWDKTSGLFKNLPAKLEIKNLRKEITKLSSIIRNAGNSSDLFARAGNKILAEAEYKRFSNAVDRQYVAQNRINRLQGKINNSIPNRARPTWSRNAVLKKFATKIPMFGVVVGGALAIPDVVNFFSIDMDTQIQKAEQILLKDRNRFKDPETFGIIVAKIKKNMFSARRWWLATIIKSITLSAVNIGVGVGTGGLGLAFSVIGTTLADSVIDMIRDWKLGFDFNLIDFENPYTFINQKELAEATSKSFMITGSNISIQNLKDEFKDTSLARMALSAQATRSIFSKQGALNAARKLNNAFKFDSLKILHDPFIGKPISQAQHLWGLIILNLCSFSVNKHCSDSSIKDNVLATDKSITVGEYGSKIIKIVSEEDPVYYPTEILNNGDLLNPFGSMSNVKLKDILNNSSNSINYVHNIVSTLRYLISLTIIFNSDVITRLRTDLKLLAKIRGKNSKTSNVILTDGFNDKSISEEFIGLYYAMIGDTNVSFSDETISTAASTANNMLSGGVDFLAKNCGLNKQDLTKMIINYSVLYLLCWEKYNLYQPMQEILVNIDIGQIQYMVNVLRSSSTWNTIIALFNELKNREGADIDLKSISANLKNIESKSSLKVEDIDVDILNNSDFSTISKIANEYKGSDLDFTDNDTYLNSNDPAYRTVAAMKYTKKLFKDKKYNEDQILAIARLVLEYIDRLNQKKDASSSDDPKDKYQKIKLDTVKDIRDNYGKAFSQFISLSDNKALISKLLNNNSPTKDDVIKALKNSKYYQIGTYKKEDYKKNFTHETSVFGENDTIATVSSDYDYGKIVKDLSKNPANNNGMQQNTQSSSTGSGASASGASTSTGVNTTVSSGSGASSGVQSSMDFNIDDVMNAQIFEGSDGKWHSNNSFVQWVINKESGGKADAKNPSGATGLFQFTPKTWWNQETGRGIMVGTDFSEATNPQTNFKAFKKLVQENYNILKRSNTPITAFSMYMAHQQGATGIANINKIISGKLKPGDKAYSSTMRNMMTNIPESMISKMEGLSDVEKAQAFMQYWEKQAGVAPTVYQIPKPTQADMEADAVKNSDGVGDVLFITGIENDMLFGTNLSI